MRYLILVSDSLTVFLAGKQTGVDLAGDLVEQVATGVMSNYKAVICKPLWGKTLPILVAQVKVSIAEFWEGIKHESRASTVEIDIAVAWLGNELVGERGLFLNPAYELWREKYYGPHHASGEWREIADRVCTSISELAALRGRPEFGDAVGVITLLGQPDPARCALPHQFDECMRNYEEIPRLCSRTGGTDHFSCPDCGHDTNVRRFPFPRGQLPAEETHGAHRASHDSSHCRAHRQQGARVPIRGDSLEIPLLGKGENLQPGGLPARH